MSPRGEKKNRRIIMEYFSKLLSKAVWKHEWN